MFRFSRLAVLTLTLALPAAAAGVRDMPGTIWRLVSIDGKPYAATATLRVTDGSGLQGEGPCNSYHAELAGSAPDFIVGPVLATRMACPDLQSEQAFFDALQAMNRAEVSDGKLVLTGPEDRSMEFQPD